MSSDIKRIGWHGVNGMQDDVNGDYVLHSDHEAEVARLRVELNAATKAGLDAIATICEKGREADALRVDAERYRWLRDTPWFDNYELRSVIAHQQNALWDKAIDAAMGEGK